MNDAPGLPDDQPDSIDLEPVRRDLPVEYGGRVQKLGFREGLLVAGGLVLVLVGAGIVAIGPPAGRAGKASPTPAAIVVASPSASIVASIAPTVAPSPTPGPTPAATPSVKCGAYPPTVPPYVNLLASSGDTPGILASIDWLSEPPDPTAVEVDSSPVTVVLGEQPVMSVNFAACALEWRISLNGEVIARQTNPAMDPNYARQAYFVLPTRIATRTASLQLDLHYRLGWTSSTWQLRVDSWPELTGFAVAGAAEADAQQGCGFTVDLPSGLTGSETCTSPLPPYITTLYVAPSTEIVFRIPQAVFTPASSGAIACGHVKGTPPAFVVDPTCTVDTFFSVFGDQMLRAPGSISIHVIEVTGCATYSGGQACGPWFFRIDSVHPQPHGQDVGN